MYAKCATSRFLSHMNRHNNDPVTATYNILELKSLFSRGLVMDLMVLRGVIYIYVKIFQGHIDSYMNNFKRFIILIIIVIFIIRRKIKKQLRSSGITSWQ